MNYGTGLILIIFLAAMAGIIRMAWAMERECRDHEQEMLDMRNALARKPDARG